MVDQRLRDRERTVPNSVAPTLNVSPAQPPARRGEDDRVDEILDREQLVAVVAPAEHVDPAAFADPVEQDLEDAEPLGPDERLRPDDRRLDGGDAARALPPRSSTRRTSRRRRAARPRRSGAPSGRRRRPSTRRARRGRRRPRAPRRAASPCPPTFTERIDSRDAWIGSAAAAWTSTSAPSTSRGRASGRGCRRAAPRRRARARRRRAGRGRACAPRGRPRAAAARGAGRGSPPLPRSPTHYGATVTQPACGCGRGCAGGFASTRIAAASRIDIADHALAERGLLRRRGRDAPPRSSRGTATSLWNAPQARASETSPSLTSSTCP